MATRPPQRLDHRRFGEAGSDPLAYDLLLPVDVALEVKVGSVNRYAATGEIPMRSAPDTSRYTTIDLLPLMDRVWSEI